MWRGAELAGVNEDDMVVGCRRGEAFGLEGGVREEEGVRHGRPGQEGPAVFSSPSTAMVVVVEWEMRRRWGSRLVARTGGGDDGPPPSLNALGEVAAAVVVSSSSFSASPRVVVFSGIIPSRPRPWRAEVEREAVEVAVGDEEDRLVWDVALEPHKKSEEGLWGWWQWGRRREVPHSAAASSSPSSFCDAVLDESFCQDRSSSI